MICSWAYVVLIYIKYSRGNPDTKLSSFFGYIALMSRNFTPGPVDHITQASTWTIQLWYLGITHTRHELQSYTPSSNLSLVIRLQLYTTCICYSCEAWAYIMWHVGPLLGNGSANRHERNNSNARGYNNNGKRCFLRGPCQDVISRTS
jgi:hypothetical protein